MPFDTRGARLDEAIEVVRRLWSEPVVAHSGRFYSFPEVAFEPKPVQRRLPVLAGGVARRAAPGGPVVRRVDQHAAHDRVDQTSDGPAGVGRAGDGARVRAGGARGGGRLGGARRGAADRPPVDAQPGRGLPAGLLRRRVRRHEPVRVTIAPIRLVRHGRGHSSLQRDARAPRRGPRLDGVASGSVAATSGGAAATRRRSSSIRRWRRPRSGVSCWNAAGSSAERRRRRPR
ncbi:LLM class flavin-dependent oxidoreductase [Nonomuraea antimicrobica]